MTTPDAAVRAQLAAQAAGVTGVPASGGLDLSAATAVSADVEKLLAQLQELQGRAQAAVDAANPPPAPPDNTLKAGGNWTAELVDFAQKVETRLHAVEVHTGLVKDAEVAAEVAAKAL